MMSQAVGIIGVNNITYKYGVSTMVNRSRGGKKKLRVPKRVVEDLKYLSKSDLLEMNDYMEVCYQANFHDMDELVEWLDNHSKADYFTVLWERRI